MRHVCVGTALVAAPRGLRGIKHAEIGCTGPMDSTRSLLSLPDDIIMPILSRLGCRGLAKAARVCRRLRLLQTTLKDMPAFVSSIAKAE